MYSIISRSILIFVFVFYLSYSEAAKASDHGKVVVCYLANWSVYRPGKGAFAIEYVDPTLCTNLVYSFAVLDFDNNDIKTLDKWQDLPDNYGKNGYAKAVKLKEKNPQLKVTIAFGGWDAGSTNFSIIASEPDRRQKLIANVLAYVKKYKFDGLDLHWKYPAERGGMPDDQENFVLLVKEFKEAFKPDNLLLTAAFGANKDTIDRAYDVAELSKYLDYVHFLSYDYHGAWDLKMGFGAPLHSFDELDVESSVNFLLDRGMDPAKLILGIPLYGQTFDFEGKPTSDAEIIGFPTKAIGFKGPYTKQISFLGYYEICLELQKPGWRKLWDDESLTPYAVNEDRAISYENKQSIQEKMKFAMRKKLGGAMVWSIDIDDFRGDCHGRGGQKFPALHLVNEAIVKVVKDEVDTNNNKNKYPLIAN